VRTLSAPLDEPVVMSCGQLGARTTVLVEVEAGSGLVGVGESWANHPHWVASERQATLADGVAPLLLGEDHRRIAAIHDKVTSALWGPVRQWGGEAILLQALSGVDIALWDLLGKTLGVSVASLIGGRCREEVAVYASGLGPSDVGATASRCAGDGFEAVKVRVGFGAGVDAANLRAAREAIGEGRALYADANRAWRRAEARQMTPLLREAGVVWVEEPLADASCAELEAFAAEAGLTVALGENLAGSAAFLPYLASPGPFLLQPDVTKVGGFGHAAAVAQLAWAAGVAVAPHFYGGAVGWAATLQLAAACPAVRSVELDVRPNPLREALLADPPQVQSGAARIPAGPGLGVAVDADRAEDHTIECRRRKL
jgi:L-alanine-DL-glutamate epimerase-like enolase superfamily enzyme